MTVEIGHENVKHFIFGKVIWTAVNHSAAKVFKQQLVKWKLLNCNNQNDVDDFLRVIELLIVSSDNNSQSPTTYPNSRK